MTASTDAMHAKLHTHDVHGKCLVWLLGLLAGHRYSLGTHILVAYSAYLSRDAGAAGACSETTAGCAFYMP
jgi:hypothetical protein